MINRLSGLLQERIEGPLDIPEETLQQITRTRMVLDEHNQPHPLHSQISTTHANALYRTVLTQRPHLILEVGMAHGVSTLAIVAALRDLHEGGRLISIDPFQFEAYHGFGVLNIKRANLSEYHELIAEPDYLALPRLAAQGITIDLAYIDGMHTFDYTLLDFFYVDKLLSPGGIVGFNDCVLPSVGRVLRFVTSHRKYREIDVGLKPNYFSRNPLVTMRRFITRTSKADRYFQKLESWEPNYDYYRDF